MRPRVQLAAIAFVCFLLTISVFGTGFATATVVNQHLHPRAEESTAFDLYWEVWGLLEKEFYGELPSDAETSYAAIRGSLTALDDPYSIFVEPQPREMERDSLRGSFGGIGAYVSQDEEGQVVLTPMEGQPAAEAGILEGDVLLAIDGNPLTADMTVEDVVATIRGPVGEEVLLTVLHPEAEEPVDITIVRAIIELPSINWAVLEQDPTVGHVQLARFTERTSDELEDALVELEEAGADKLILDLRSNGGGLLQAAVDVADLFLDGGAVLHQLKAGEQEKAFRASKGGPAIDLPLVILVNGGTASAAEIVAGALQDHGRAPLVGTATFGKGSVQNIHDLSDGSSLHVTTARWYTPDHRQLDGQGLTPDVVVSLVEGGDDAQLARAIEYLSGE